jgi:NAD(P)H dehydrogenase (quinone)
MPQEILVLYYSRSGHTAQLARLIARGIEEVDGMQARLRQVPPVAPVTEIAQPPEPENGAPYAWGWRWAARPASAIWLPR